MNQDPTMTKEECIESKYFPEEYFCYSEDGNIYDRDTGEIVAIWKGDYEL